MKTKTTEVEVDIDLDDFDAEELINEISRRFKDKELDSSEREALIDMVCVKKTSYQEGRTTSTMEDTMKMEHLEKIWQKYTLAEMQRRLPE